MGVGRACTSGAACTAKAEGSIPPHVEVFESSHGDIRLLKHPFANHSVRKTGRIGNVNISYITLAKFHDMFPDGQADWLQQKLADQILDLVANGASLTEASTAIGAPRQTFGRGSIAPPTSRVRLRRPSWCGSRRWPIRSTTLPIRRSR